MTLIFQRLTIYTEVLGHIRQPGIVIKTTVRVLSVLGITTNEIIKRDHRQISE